MPVSGDSEPGPSEDVPDLGFALGRRRSAVEMWVDAERAQVALGEAAGQRGRGFADGIEAAARAHVGAQHPAFGRATEQQISAREGEIGRASWRESVCQYV